MTAVVMCFLIAQSQPTQPQLARPKAVTLTVLGTTDVHGRLASLPLLGGYVEAVRRARPRHVILIDSGDMYQGTLESDQDEGASLLAAYRALGYDAVAFGNHEFDYGPIGPRPTARTAEEDARGALKARAREALGAFPFLSANIWERGAPLAWDNVRPSTVITREGVRVGIIGVSTERTPVTTIAANFAGLTMRPLAENIVAEATRLRQGGVQVVIVAAHAGGHCRRFSDPDTLTDCDPEAEIFRVARALPHGAVDAIFAGHTHTAVAHRINGIAVVQSFALGRALARVDLRVDPASGAVSSTIYPPIELVPFASYEGFKVAEHPEVARAVAPALAKAQTRRSQAIGASLTRNFERSYGEESALGNLVASMLLAHAPRAQVALINGGSLRANLPAGALDYGELYTALPFENFVALVTMNGAALRRALAINFAEKSGIFSIGGARAVARCNGKKLEVDIFLADGTPLRDDQAIVVVTTDFVATGGDGFEGAKAIEIVGEQPLREAFVAELSKQPAPISPSSWLSSETPRLTLPGRRPIRCPL